MIEFERVSKRFPGVQALSDVSFTIERGACHALLGENGAGKSTLGKILAGIERPDSGRVLLDGRPVDFRSPRDAAAAGVGVVHQELVFCPNLSVAENLCLHDLPAKGWVVDRPAMRRRAQELLARIGMAERISVDRLVGELSIAQEQMVQIAAAVGLDARVLVFDEPTSSLAAAEVDHLFKLIRQLQRDGVTIVYVSHRLEEIFELCRTASILRDGQCVAVRELKDVDHNELVRLMVGRQVEPFFISPLQDAHAPVRLEVKNLTSPGKFENVSLSVRAGEIVGLAGLVGAGRTETLEAIFGVDPLASGEISLDGKPTLLKTPKAAAALGLGLIPEDRKRRGLVLDMSVRENTTLPILDRFRRWLGAADVPAERALTQEYCDKLAVRTPHVEARVGGLSGGNQQKIVLAKWTAAEGRVLLVDEPTRGVDVGAKREIHELLGRLAAEGRAILLVSSELPELLALSHRVIVM
ncbi:MAG TPA: sugar ABC transporter ATP-binding protein, partial [Pirellulales bacterium]